MPPTVADIDAAREQLERVLASAGFSRNERLSRFLRFVVETHLDGPDADLKESVIAVEVFGRKADHDPKQDSIVRTEAARLRARLAEYYAAEGKRDPFVIELPKGGYVPAIRAGQPDPELVARDVRVPAPTVSRRRVWFLRSLCAVAAIAALAVWLAVRPRAPITIAVLPLTNLSQDAANEYFADGLSDEIIRNLSILDGLAVRSRTSSFAFKGKTPDLRDAGRQLNAEYIVEGSVARSGQQLRIDAQLVRVRDDFAVWAGRFDRELTDVFAVQDEISRGIVNGLRLKLGRGRRRYETSIEAYDLYLRGRALGQDQAVEAFQQAIAKDQSFAPAYAGLAAARAYRSGLFRLNAADEVREMRAAAAKAIELDPMLAEAHDALAMAYARDGDWARCERSFRRAIDLDRNRSETRDHYALYYLWPLDRTDQAIMELRRAASADPLSTRIDEALSYVLLSAGKYDEAASYAERLPRDSQFRSAYLGRARLLQGKTAEAIQILEGALSRGVTPGSEVRAALGYAYARAGRRDEAEKLAATTNPFNQAVIYAGLGDKRRAIEAMERGATAGPFRVGRQLTWPELASIRNDQKMNALRRSVGLP